MSTYKKQKRKLEREIKQWEQEKQIIIAKQKLTEDKKETLKKKNKLSTSKFLMFFLFISCSIIEAFTMYVTIKGMNMGLGADFGPLQMLITAVVGEVIGYAVYSLKALKENTEGGIVYQSNLLNNYAQLIENIENENENENNKTSQEAEG